VNGAERRFTLADQEWFARVSGDHNPLHMDAAFASRTFPGAPVVHGMHALLWALDQRCAASPSIRLTSVQASFIKPILVGDHVTASGGDTIWLLVRGETMAAAALTKPSSQMPEPIDAGARWPVGSPALDRAGEDLSGVCGEIELPEAAEELAGAFPSLARAAEPGFAVGLAGISKLIGMVCPGRHGILSEVAVTAATSGRRTLAFTVVRHDHRVSRVEMAVAGPGLKGSAVAFAGAPDPPPLDDATVRKLVPEGGFVGQTPLIIGATSGLGAAAARLLVAGGAQPVLGYRDQTSAQAVQKSLRGGDNCKLVAFDVTAPLEGLNALTAMGWRGGQVYYFASPRIFRRRIEPYQADDLRDFVNVFVTGFYETVRGLLEIRGGEPLTVFYPSTAALDEATSDLFEYRTAKLAGEELCKRLSNKYPNLTIISPRLPRIITRQTRTFVKVRAELPEDVLASFVNEVQTSGRRTGQRP